MRVLSHGVPFFCDETPLRLYDGPHDIRYLGNYAGADYQYNPLEETATEVIDRIASEWPPDLLLLWMTEVHPPPRGIEDVPVPTVALASDWNVFYPILAVNLARYDVVLCDKAGVGVFRSELVSPHHLFPLYSQISTIHRPWPVEKDIDVLFIGNLSHVTHAVRAKFLERLAKLSDRYRVVICGGVFGEDYGRLLCRAKIVFNHSVRGELNLRVLETMACGSLAFLEEGNLEIADWFEDGRELVLYNDSNFEDRIAHFLEHPDEAEAIAARGHQRAPEFAGENRLTDIVDWASTRPSSGRRFRELPEAEQRYQDFLMYGLSRWQVYQPIEAELIGQLMSLAPDDPRVWTAVAQHVANHPEDAGGNEQVRERAAKAIGRAYQLNPSSAPRALNVATMFGAHGNTDGEAHFLQQALDADSLDGAEHLLGLQATAFGTRWHLALAYRTHSIEMLHAEARIRLATILAGAGHPALAEDHLHNAEQLDPENTGGFRLLAEILWTTERRDEAIETLQRGLPKMQFDSEVRERLYDMLLETGRDREAGDLAEETLRIARACPDTAP